MTTFNAWKLAPKSNSRNLAIVIKIMYLATFFTINITNCYSNNCQCITDNMVLLLILELGIPACTYIFRVVHEWEIDKWFNISNSIYMYLIEVDKILLQRQIQRHHCLFFDLLNHHCCRNILVQNIRNIILTAAWIIFCRFLNM